MSDTVKGRLEVLTAVLFFSTTGLTIKYVPMSGIAIAGCKCFLAMLFHFAYLKLSGRKLTCNLSTLIGALFIAGDLTLYTASAKLTTATNAVMLENTSPIFVILISWLILKKKPQPRELLVCGGVFAGILLFFVDGLSGGSLPGNAIALCSGICYATMILLSRIPGCDSRSAYVIGFAMAAVIGLPSAVQFTAWTPAVVAGLLFMGFFQAGLAYVLLDAGTRRISSVEASLLCTLDPIINSALVILIYGERVTLWSLTGAVIVIGFIIFYTRSSAA